MHINGGTHRSLQVIGIKPLDPLSDPMLVQWVLGSCLVLLSGEERSGRSGQPTKITPRVHQVLISEVTKEPRTAEESQASFVLKTVRSGFMIQE